MDDFTDYFLRQEYTKIAILGNKLGEIRDIIDWEQFRPTIGSKNSLIFIYFVHRYLPEKKLT